MKTTNETVTVNDEQKLFVIPGNGGVSCLGFQVLEDRLIRLGSELTKELTGLEGKRVELTDDFGTRRFIVGKSTGFIPCHLEIKTRRSSGGGAVCARNIQRVRVL